MTSHTSLQQITIPAMSDPPAQYAASWATAFSGPDSMEARLVMQFADAAERDSRISTGDRRPGMLCWLQNPGTYSFYDGAIWSNMPRTRQVADRAGRTAIGSKRIGDYVTELDTGWSFIWTGTRWKGLQSNAYDGTIVGVADIGTTEVTVGRLTIPDQGCRVRITILVQLLINKDVQEDIFTVNIKNGTGLPDPVSTGTVIGQINYETDWNTLSKSWSGPNEYDADGSYDVVVNVSRFGGTGTADVPSTIDQPLQLIRAIAHPV